ncbi:MAG: DUF1848 domain-containing protein [Spirochaetaceae bacterium]|nr:DUF1848 domain-containing protein [Spirochaetaceae bacterium]
MIVSASRRCDIPAHYMDWMMSRIELGYCLSRNPFNPRLATRIPLASPELSCLVFWTRDPAKLALRTRELASRGIPFFAQVTITGLPRALEPGLPDLTDIIHGFSALADAIGPKLVVWRFDPVFVARNLDSDSRIRDFENLAAALEGKTSRVVVSLLDEYSGTRARLERALFPDAVFARPRDGGRSAGGPAGGPSGLALSVPPAPYPSLLADLAAIAASRGMEVRACAEGFDLVPYGIRPGACIDPELVALASGFPFMGSRDSGQRRDCRCARSVDIGAYGSCPAGCAYCYANRGRGRLLHPQAEDESLVPAPGRAGGAGADGSAKAEDGSDALLP